MTRVGFTLIDSSAWTGGYNYLINLFGAVLRHHGDRIQPVLFCGEDARAADLLPFSDMPGAEIVRHPTLDAHHKALRLARALLLGLDTDAYRLYRTHEIDVVFENAAFTGRRMPLPVIAWMPDFQHQQLRDQFGRLAFWRRELGFRAQARHASVIMLSSEEARRDCERLYPITRTKTRVVRFAAPIAEGLFEAGAHEVPRQYELPATYFYLPNQFWKHKNHQVVIDALVHMKARGTEAVVAASGNPVDPRHPDHLASIHAQIAAHGLETNFRMLGLIPRRHVVSLMRNCAALINPSYFEGWSSTVEEARSLRVPMLLSDIGVHREQMGGDARYFHPDDPGALAREMTQLLASPPSLDCRPKRYDDLDVAHIRRFADDFLGVVDHVTGTHP